MFPSNYKMRIPNRYPIKDLHASFSHDREIFETKTAEALQRFGAVKFAMSVHVGLKIKVEGDKTEYRDYYNRNEERKRVPMVGVDKIENLLEDSYYDLQSQIDIFTNNGLYLDVE